MEQAMIKQKGTEVTEVILHTSATPGRWYKGKTAAEMRDEIRGWHVNDRKWSDIGYHYVVAPSGDVAHGRPVHRQGAHVRGKNLGTIGICMIPVKTIRVMGKFEDFYTEEQRVAVKELIKGLPGIKKVTGHNQYAAKLCPGFLVNSEDWLPCKPRRFTLF